MRRAVQVASVAGLVFLLAAQCVRADVIFDSLSQTPAGYATVAGGVPFAQGFSVGASNYDLTNVILSMNEFEPSGAVSGGDAADFTLSIYDASGVDNSNLGYGAPGNLLTTLVGSNDPITADHFTYTPSSPFQLDANTTYYVVADSTSTNGRYNWDYINDNNANVGAGVYGYPDPLGGWNMGGPDQPQIMQVNATSLSTPEPGTIGMFFIVMGMAGWIRRRRK